MNRFAACLALTLLLAACGSNDGYPSLARRPVERNTKAVQPVATPAPPQGAPDLAQESRLARMEQQARDAHAGFIALVPRTRDLVAAAQGAAATSEVVSVASIALGQLESRRSEAMIALADCDALYVKDRIGGTDSEAISATRERISALVAQEDQILAELRDKLPG